jgi:hypothetical protein
MFGSSLNLRSNPASRPIILSSLVPSGLPLGTGLGIVGTTPLQVFHVVGNYQLMLDS